ncbi:hypothetical protein OG554_03625 [Streptomyces griseus]|uniref:hypothetical protein n=1 Tax=Streptomyces griseus TaxID=1911 RepID=UPI003869FD95|nr:hypothetical protein OG554_03625 [Streptomyces fimicarius]
MSFDYSKPPRTVPLAQARHLSDDAKRQAQGAAFAAACVVMVLAIPIQAFILMLVMGAAHGAFIAVPAIGYGTSVLFVLGLNMLAGFTRRLFRK